MNEIKSRERDQRVAMYVRRLTDGCDIWTGQPLSKALLAQRYDRQKRRREHRRK